MTPSAAGRGSGPLGDRHPWALGLLWVLSVAPTMTCNIHLVPMLAMYHGWHLQKVALTVALVEGRSISTLMLL